MKRPKQLPAVERNARISAASHAMAGVSASMIAKKTIGRQPSPACRLLSEHRCK